MSDVDERVVGEWSFPRGEETSFRSPEHLHHRADLGNGDSSDPRDLAHPGRRTRIAFAKAALREALEDDLRHALLLGRQLA